MVGVKAPVGMRGDVVLIARGRVIQETRAGPRLMPVIRLPFVEHVRRRGPILRQTHVRALRRFKKPAPGQLRLICRPLSRGVSPGSGLLAASPVLQTGRGNRRRGGSPCTPSPRSTGPATLPCAERCTPRADRQPYHEVMATDRERDPYQAEGEAILAANPGLREKLEEKLRLAIEGKLDTVDSSGIDAALAKALGRPLEGD